MSAPSLTPWAYSTGPALYGRYHTVVDANDDMVCECYEGDEATQEANARLIAAAPELLEICQEFVRRVDAGEVRSKRTYAAMKAAIAKVQA